MSLFGGETHSFWGALCTPGFAPDCQLRNDLNVAPISESKIAGRSQVAKWRLWGGAVALETPLQESPRQGPEWRRSRGREIGFAARSEGSPDCRRKALRRFRKSGRLSSPIARSKDSRCRHSKSPTETNATFTIPKRHLTIGILVRSIVIATAPIRTAPNTMF